ncbi:hypothetical protein [Actinacidiphila yanglinensis]|uniref:hypothetical protein n=1 Tax=Actinacidiphila yanglinensis TaxID=310779 RepID=UPI0011B01464|nr:hypothetical protein [Actinacidiphila yanglinensis]
MSLAVMLGADLVSGERIRIGALMVAVPALPAVFRPRCREHSRGAGHRGAGRRRSVLAARTRRRRERQLAKVRKVAEATRRPLLRPLPDRLGRVTISSMYLAAEEEGAAMGPRPLASRIRAGVVRGERYRGV